MESLIHAFGLDIKVMIVQIVNFVLLAGALMWFLYTPILKVLRDREETIARGLADAADASKAKASAEEGRIAVLTSAEKEARDIVAHGVKVADEKATAITAAADEKATKRLTQAEVRGEEIIAQAKERAEAEIAKLAVLDLEKKLIALAQ